MFPKECKYAETHEWARPEKDIVTVGISSFAVEQLGDIVYLELPKVGAKVQKGSSLGMVESVKATSDLYTPVSGEVTEVNNDISNNLEAFKSDPYGAAWLVKIKASDKKELDSLMDAETYEKQVEGH
jgi:glycine cleavage system H protein